jgi:predicted HTH domain antitoxin
MGEQETQPVLDPKVAVVLNRFRKSEITIRQAAELLHISYTEMDELLRQNQIPLVQDVATALGRKARPPKR